MTSKLDWVRAGALAAGVFTLLVIWWIGLAMLGYLQWPLRMGWTWYGTAIVSVAAGATLAHRQPGPWLRRILLALLLGGAIGGALFGLVHVLVMAGLRTRGLTAVFAVLGGALVASGLRRLPARKPARAALLTLVGLLTLVRLLATFPAVARYIERRFFPLPPTVVRNHWNQYRCRAPCLEYRGRVIDWRIDDLSYAINDYESLTADVRMIATIESLKPYFIDGCNEVRETPPEIPENVRQYATTAACKAANPIGWYQGRPLIGHFTHNCCLTESHHRQPGDRFESKRTTRFVFHRLAWESQVEEPDPGAPRRDLPDDAHGAE